MEELAQVSEGSLGKDVAQKGFDCALSDVKRYACFLVTVISIIIQEHPETRPINFLRCGERFVLSFLVIKVT